VREKVAEQLAKLAMGVSPPISPKNVSKSFGSGLEMIRKILQIRPKGHFVVKFRMTFSAFSESFRSNDAVVAVVAVAKRRFLSHLQQSARC